jgi:hypothetical protein
MVKGNFFKMSGLLIPDIVHDFAYMRREIPMSAAEAVTMDEKAPEKPVTTHRRHG